MRKEESQTRRETDFISRRVSKVLFNRTVKPRAFENKRFAGSLPRVKLRDSQHHGSRAAIEANVEAWSRFCLGPLVDNESRIMQVLAITGGEIEGLRSIVFVRCAATKGLEPTRVTVNEFSIRGDIGTFNHSGRIQTPQVRCGVGDGGE